jgi:HK97 family phage portal protein
MPIDIFRTVDGIDVTQQKPPVFITPGGDEVDWCEWAYSSQDDLDANGNTIGVITGRGGNGLPSQIELVPFGEVGVQGRGGRIEKYRINGEAHTPAQIWHERQFTRPGMPIGLSPIAHAAMGIGGYLSAQEFARDWFSGGGIPSARLKNTAKRIDPAEAQTVKDRFKATVGTGDLFVTGSDWEYETIQAKASESAFIEQMQFSITDVCRFLGVPADMIDAESSTGSITYANVTQRNLQLLIMNLNPVLRRREATFSRRLLPAPRIARFNRAALLEMDLKTRYEAHMIGIASHFLAPSEVRTIEDRPPFTPEQLAEFEAMAAEGTMPKLTLPAKSGA